MSDTPDCPQCQCDYTYADAAQIICPMCNYEWVEGCVDEMQKVYQDAYGNVLTDGDSVTLIKNLKVKGTSSTLKTGTKVKNIRLSEGDHDIDCKVDGIGPMKLKTQFVKKA